MIIIADNITTRNAKINRAFQQGKATGWKDEDLSQSIVAELARRCVEAGADILEINVQQHHDRPEAMEFAVRAIQQLAECQLCLSTDNAETLEAGLRVCKRPPLVNYISLDEPRLLRMLPLVAQYNAEVVLLLTDPTIPSDMQEMLTRAAALVGAANEAGIPNDRIFVDPGIFHAASDMGGRHLTQVIEFLRAMPEAFDPSVRSVCRISNISASIPRRLRPALETALLAMLSGLGLSSAFLDVLRRENMRMVHVIEILKNETIYSDRDIEL